MKHLILVLGFVALTAASDSAEQLDYHNQEDWGDICTDADSLSQSPIDISDCKEVKMNKKGKMVRHKQSIKSLTLKNQHNSNSIKFEVKNRNFSVPWIEGRRTVTLLQLHLHWGAEASEGSEHLLEGVQYSAESHLVTSYEDGDGNTKYMVFARVYQATDEEGNEQIGQMIAAQQEAGDLEGFKLSALYPSKPGPWYSYHGSLTTPTCDEVVHWVVVQEPLPISNDQLESLRVLPLGDGSMDPLTFNWRNTQERNGRECHRYV